MKEQIMVIGHKLDFLRLLHGKMKKIHIIGGGTVAHVANHLALCAPAYGETAEKLAEALLEHPRQSHFEIEATLTKMAGGDKIETNEDVAEWVDKIKADPETKIVFFNVALVDFRPTAANYNHPVGSTNINIGKYSERLSSRHINQLEIRCAPVNKLVPEIRKGRKDIFLVAFKTTCGATDQEMFEKGLKLCKEGSCNLVLVNDVKNRLNMIITPEEAAYHKTYDREVALRNLVDMAFLRSHLTFTQSTVVNGVPVAWNDPSVPEALRAVVNYCIKGRAYKPFNGATVGHFACKVADDLFLTSIRRSNFNDLEKNGLVLVKTDGPDTVLAFGAKPSVGGQSQRIVFNDHPGFDCIVHFHCPLKQNPFNDIPIRSQREFECGSHECGRNTSDGLKQFGNLKAVFLDKHGPNIVFPKTINPQEVINFIERNFDLDKKTGGYNL